MSYSSDYTITSLSSSIEQRTFKNGATRAPFSLGGNGRIGLRGGCIPYIAFGSGQVPSYPKQPDCNDVAPTPPSSYTVSMGEPKINFSRVYDPEVSVGSIGGHTVDMGDPKINFSRIHNPSMGGGTLTVNMGDPKINFSRIHNPATSGGQITIGMGDPKINFSRIHNPEVDYA